MGRDALGGNTAWIYQRMSKNILVAQLNASLTHDTSTAPTPSVAADPKFKKYAQAVEKCLATFDNVHEWADFIAFLSKLLKASAPSEQVDSD